MSFHDVRFPDRIALGATGGPQWKTLVARTANGSEVRVQTWAQALGRWDVGSGLATREHVAELIAFFRARRGRAFAFRFKDWSDFVMPRQNIGVTNGTQATYQIFRRYTSGPAIQDRVITRPVSGTVRCWVDNVERTLGAGSTQFQVNHSTGVVTIGSALAATTGKAVEVSCEFDVPARFDTDEMPLTLELFTRGNWPDIPVVEIRE